jgi:NAD(P)H-hydrate epimerase
VDVLEVKDPASDFSKLETALLLGPALIIDGLFGIGINRPLDAAWVQFIERLNAAQLQVLAVDVPSGLNADTGGPEGAAVQASITLTVGAPKVGLLKTAAWPFVGRLEVAKEVGLVACSHSSELVWTSSRISPDFRPSAPPLPTRAPTVIWQSWPAALAITALLFLQLGVRSVRNPA